MLERTAPPLLACEGLRAGWAGTEVLNGIGFDIDEGETIAILGRNGVGKTTLLSAIMGRAEFRGGAIRFRGLGLEKQSIEARSRKGIGLVPQEREIFRSLTVEENLRIAERSGAAAIDQVYDLFPRLAERRRNMGAHLSGGEQQMLAIARALMGEPKLLMLDEPMEGLAPVIVEMLIAAISRIRNERKLAILLVEQHVSIALSLAQRALVLDRGRIVYDNGRTRGPDAAEIEELIALRHAA